MCMCVCIYIALVGKARNADSLLDVPIYCRKPVRRAARLLSRCVMSYDAEEWKGKVRKINLLSK